MKRDVKKDCKKAFKKDPDNEILFMDGIFHSGLSETDTFAFMTVKDGMITGTYRERPAGTYTQIRRLAGQHVYPCLIDTHVHLLPTVVNMAMGFSVCEFTEKGIRPCTIEGVLVRLETYAKKQKQDAMIICTNYIPSAMDQIRMPTRQELDHFGGQRPVILYSIDGHSTSLSSAMLRLVGLDPEKSSGVLTGEENERAQGRLIDLAGKRVTPSLLAGGIADFHNACAAYGIGTVAALEGNGDSPADETTKLIAYLARHFEVGIRLYPQYTDLKRVKFFRKWMKNPRVGGCGDWEMDGSVGSHSAAFAEDYLDTGRRSDCYHSREQVHRLVREADAKGFQIAAHAIGTEAINLLTGVLNETGGARLHRIEHFEFPSEESVNRVLNGTYAVVMQPGYAWIDARYLHTYEKYLPPEVRSRSRLRTLVNAGVCVCGSSDSPVQDLDPWLQMQGMVQFYPKEESISIFDAFRCYTSNAAKALQEEQELGTLETGKRADFFTSREDLFALSDEQIAGFRPDSTWYGGKRCREKKGTLKELAGMLLKKPVKI